MGYFYLYSNDGSANLASNGDWDAGTVFNIKQNGIYFRNSCEAPYDFTNTGVALKPNATEPTYSVGDSFELEYSYSNVSLYLVDIGTPKKISGKWRLNDFVNLKYNGPALTYNGGSKINFTSNGASFDGIYFAGFSTRNNHADWEVYYAANGINYLVLTVGSEWTDDPYRYIDFGSTEQEVSNAFYAWLTENAEQMEEEPTNPTINFDLSTLGLSAGTHRITVKARASGYADSAESEAVSYAASDLITFTIGGTTYQAVSGMTWGEWVESEYNTDGEFLVSGSGYVEEDDDGVPGITEVVYQDKDVDSNPIRVKADETITNLYEYKTHTSHGGSL